MRNLLTLTVLELRSLYWINRYRYTRDKKEKNRWRMLAAAAMVLVATVVSYVGGLVYGLCYLGLGQLVPAYLVVIASVLVFFVGVFKAGPTLFSPKGYGLLRAMPVRTGQLVLARFLSMYAQDLLLTGLVFLPGMGLYGYMCRPGPGFYGGALAVAVLTPALALVPALVFGAAIMAISARLKHKSLIQTVLTVALVVGVLLLSFGAGSVAQSITPEYMADLAGKVSQLLGKLYPPAAWAADALLGRNPWGIVLFGGVALGLLAISVAVISWRFSSIMERLQSVGAGHRYTLGALESRSLLKALYLREGKRYFASPIYVTNTILGPIMGCILAGAVCFAELQPLQVLLPVELAVVAPFAFGAVFCMMTITATSISMEGKQFWIIQSLPIPAKTLLDSKLLLNLSLMLPFYVLAESFLLVGLRPDALSCLWMVLIPALISVFSVVFGIYVNLKLHSFDWQKEEQVVKQSASAALGGFAGPVLGAGLGACAAVMPAAYLDLARLAMCVGLGAATVLLYRHNSRTRPELL